MSALTIQWEEIQAAFKTVSERVGDKSSLGKNTSARETQGNKTVYRFDLPEMRSGKLSGRTKREAGAVTQETVVPEKGGHNKMERCSTQTCISFCFLCPRQTFKKRERENKEDFS